MQLGINVIAAFSEDHVERLTGLTKRQLRYWDKTGFFSPAYVGEDRRSPYSRVYSFRNVVALRTLGVLIKKHRVTLPHLRKVAKALKDLKDALWIKRALYVLERRIVLLDEATGRLHDPVSGQYVIGIPLRTIISDVAREADQLRVRRPDQIGRVERNRFVVRNRATVAGTRIPIDVIKRFHAAGYSTEAIRKEYPDLTAADIEAAVAHEEHDAAA